MDQVVRIGTELIALAIFFGLLSLILRRREAATHFHRAKGAMAVNATIAVIDTLTVAPLLAGTLLLIQAAVPVPPQVADLRALWVGAPVLATVICVLAADFIGYWRHRLEHNRWLWPSHLFHHADRAMNWTTGYRFHPFNRASTSLIDGLFLYFCGFPLYAIVVANVVRHWYGIFIHADLPWTFGPLGRVFMSPVGHRWHHATDSAAHSKNYATLLSAYDFAFGTLYLPAHLPTETGVDGPHIDGAVDQLLYPLRPSAYLSDPIPATTNLVVR